MTFSVDMKIASQSDNENIATIAASTKDEQHNNGLFSKKPGFHAKVLKENNGRVEERRKKQTNE